MKSATVRIADETRTIEPVGDAPSADTAVDATEPRSPYLLDLDRLVDEIEVLFPEVIQALRARIANLERLLAKKDENPFIQHGTIAATHEVVGAIHRVIQRIVGRPSLP